MEKALEKTNEFFIKNYGINPYLDKENVIILKKNYGWPAGFEPFLREIHINGPYFENKIRNFLFKKRNEKGIEWIIEKISRELYKLLIHETVHKIHRYFCEEYSEYLENCFLKEKYEEYIEKRSEMYICEYTVKRLYKKYPNCFKMEVLVSLEELLGTFLSSENEEEWKKSIEDSLSYEDFGYVYLKLYDLEAVYNFFLKEDLKRILSMGYKEIVENFFKKEYKYLNYDR